MEEIVTKFNGDLRIPENFSQTAPPHSNVREKTKQTPKPVINPQTKQFCTKLHVTNPNEVFLLEACDSDDCDSCNSDRELTVNNRSISNTKQEQEDEFEIVFE